MPDATTASVKRSQVHTEVRQPFESVIARIVWFIAGVIDVLIAMRFVLEMFGANAEAGFVKLVYGVSDIFMAPFIAVFGTSRVAGARFEWSALVAIAIYALIAWGIVALIGAVSPRDHAQTVERVESNDDSVAQQ
jgi:hypothetical protein